MLKNYWTETATSVKKIGLALRALVATIAGTGFIQGDIKLAFYVTIAGGVLDFILQNLPPDKPGTPGAISSAAPGNDGTTKGVMAVIALLACCLLVSSCSVIKPQVNTVKTDSSYTTYKPETFNIKGAQVFKTLNMDSLVKAALIARDVYKEDSASMAKYKVDSAADVKAHRAVPIAPVLVPPKIQYVTDPNTKAQLSYWIDQAGKIQLGCEAKDQTIQTLQATVNTIQSTVITKIVPVTKTPLWATVLMWVEAVLLAICIIILLIKSII